MIQKNLNFCFNPHCKQPQNLDENIHCHSCGSSLQLANRYQAIQVLGQGEGIRTLLVIDRQTSLTLFVVKQFWSSATCFYPMRSIYELSGQAVQKLASCSQIPQCLEQIEQDNILYLVQEYIPGKNLAHILAQKGTFNTQEIWQILEGLLPTISQIHAYGVIHGDIKPENIICRIDKNSSLDRALENLVLVDVGIAKLQTEIETLQLTLGSPVYAAPEQLLGKPVFESDLYSLGVMCIYLLTGIHPFSLCDASGRWVWRDYWLTETENDRGALAQFLDWLIAPDLAQRMTTANKALIEIQNLRGKKIILTDSLPKRSLTGKCDATFLGHDGLFATVNAIALNSNSQILASASDDKTIRLWNLQTLAEQGILQGHTQQVKTVAFHPQLHSVLASGSRDRTIKIWNLETREVIQTLTGHEQGVNVVIFSNPQLLVSGSADKRVKIWNFETGKAIATLKGHTLAITALSAYKTLVASASADSTVKLWNLETNRLLHTLTKHTAAVQAVAFSPNGKWFATAGSDRTIHLWDTASWQHKSTLSGHPWAISGLAFSNNGETLISSSWDKTLKLWDVSTAKEIGLLTGHTDSINCMTLDPNKNAIFSGSCDRTIKLWSYF